MKAYLRSVRIAPKKANLVAGLVRGRPVVEAITIMERTNKKAARIIEQLLRSAVANARSNDNQNPDVLVVKTLVVNKAQAYHRGVPMARGRVRPMRKFLSHLSLTLGIEGVDDDETATPKKKAAKDASQAQTKTVQSAGKSEKGKPAASKAKGTASSAASSAAPKTAKKTATPKTSS